MSALRTFAKFALAVVITATLTSLANAQSADEWVTDFLSNRDHARLNLRHTFEKVRDTAVKHYQQTDPARADFVRAMEPNIIDLEDLVILTKSEDKLNHRNTPLEKVAQRYIVEKSQKASSLAPK